MEKNAQKFLRLFPLEVIVFPGEPLHLHVFEPRYKKLVNECLDTGETFGIPVFRKDEMTGLGTEIRIDSLDKRYENGEMDIRTSGVSVFRVMDYFPASPDDYPSGNVALLISREHEDPSVRLKLVDHIRQFWSIVVPGKEVNIPEKRNLSWEFGHKVGLNREQELELLSLEEERTRQVLLLQHLQHVLPLLEELEKLKERIRLNGHFRKLTL